MSSTEEKQNRNELTNKSSSSVEGLDSSGEKAPVEHDTVDTAPAANANQPTPVGFTELFR